MQLKQLKPIGAAAGLATGTVAMVTSAPSETPADPNDALVGSADATRTVPMAPLTPGGRR